MEDVLEAGGDLGDAVLDEVWDGLRATPKYLPSKLFYDAIGSELFSRITELPEYYLTRAEGEILARYGPDLARLAQRDDGEPIVLVEPGCGASTKAAAILAHLAAPIHVGIDISPEALALGAAELRARVPHARILPMVGDYTLPGWVPPSLPRGRRVAFFPGSTIGNFEPESAQGFLARLARLVGADGLVILGADLWKSPDLLRPAYDDAQGVTAAFNRNLLAHVVRRFGGDLDPERFRHQIVVDDVRHRVEMHLVSDGPQLSSVGGRTVRFAPGESIHTENSYKWTVDELNAMARAAGLEPVQMFSDERGWFAVHVFAVRLPPAP